MLAARAALCEKPHKRDTESLNVCTVQIVAPTQEDPLGHILVFFVVCLYLFLALYALFLHISHKKGNNLEKPAEIVAGTPGLKKQSDRVRDSDMVF